METRPGFSFRRFKEKRLNFLLANFAGLISLLFLFKIYLAAVFPVIGDEAYYFYWGLHPAGGYYDLSPMIGWWESLFTSVSLNPLWLRLPNLLTTALVAFGMQEWLASVIDKKRARLIAFLYWIAPIHFLGVLIAPDVPLLLFTFFACFLFDRALLSSQRFVLNSADGVMGADGASQFDSNLNLKKHKSDLKPQYFKFLGMLFFAGILWGAAFASKYFAVFLIFPVLIFFVLQSKSRRRFSRYQYFLGLGALVAGAFPFLFQHLWWNSQNCWANFVFNFLTRQKIVDGPLYETLGLYFVYLVILATPFLLKDAFTARLPKHTQFKSEVLPALEVVSVLHAGEVRLRQFLFLLWFVPILTFGFTALNQKGQGLHWYLSYTPFFFMWVGLALTEAALLDRIKKMLVLTGILAISVTLFLQNPEPVLKFLLKGRHEQDLKVVLAQKPFQAMIEPWLKQVNLVVADNYSLASVFTVQFGKQAPEVYVWGEGSRFGRVFDWTSHFDRYRNQNVLMIARGVWPAHRWDRYFSEVKSEWVEIEGVKYWLSVGYGFRDRLYRDEVLLPAYQKNYYGFFPQFLPQKCSFLKE